MGRGVAQTLQAIDFGQAAEQPAKAPGPATAIGRRAVIGVDVLAQQGDFHRHLPQPGARPRPPRRRPDASIPRPGYRAPRRRCRTCRSPPEPRGRRPVPAMAASSPAGVELRFDREIGVQNTRARHRPQRPGNQTQGDGDRSAAQHDIDLRRAPQDLPALRLGHTTGDGDHHACALGRLFLLEAFQPAEFGKHLFRRLSRRYVQVLRMTMSAPWGVSPDCIAERRQDIRHARGVIDVHLAAVCLDEELLGQVRITIDSIVDCTQHYSQRRRSAVCTIAHR